MFIKLNAWIDEEKIEMIFRKNSIIAVQPYFDDKSGKSEITLITGEHYVVYGKMNDIASALTVTQHYGDNPIKFGDYLNPFDPDKRL